MGCSLPRGTAYHGVWGIACRGVLPAMGFSLLWGAACRAWGAASRGVQQPERRRRVGQVGEGVGVAGVWVSPDDIYRRPGRAWLRPKAVRHGEKLHEARTGTHGPRPAGEPVLGMCVFSY